MTAAIAPAPSTAVRPDLGPVAADAFPAEHAAVEQLRTQARLPVETAARVEADALELAEAIRAKSGDRLGVETFLATYSLSTAEGVALMCLAEALLRIPDRHTVDALIGDRLGEGEWDARLGGKSSVFMNASAWGLALTGRLLQWDGGTDAGSTLRRMIARLGKPVVRTALETAMRLMGKQFVMGETIEQALRRGQDAPPGTTHSFDMLGEAARTQADAERYWQSYSDAIAAIRRRCDGQDPTRNPGISVKLSALHPRYEAAKRDRVLRELLPRTVELARQAKDAGINFTIDAEEADRLILSLELFERLARDPTLAGWDGLGLAVQAYQKRALAVAGWLDELSADTNRRFMVRLVKGAYWDTEIKRAQERGLPDYPVFTRKAATDISYRACAARLLAAEGRIYPQFATHNPRTALEIMALAGKRRDYEFQKLHGMGDSLYELLRERHGAALRLRVYAPVGDHKDLLPYLVRRLLENGANTSFVHQVADPAAPLQAIVADPVRAVGEGEAALPPPAALYPDRRNSAGLDLSDLGVLGGIARQVADDRAAAPADGPGAVYEPGDRSRVVGHQPDMDAMEAADAVARAHAAYRQWDAQPANARAEVLERAADLMEDARTELMSLLIREGGKTIPDALAEVREAVDFCRYYAVRARAEFGTPIPLPGPTGERNTLRLSGRGVFVCISPWNFPLAIFIGQVAAALAAGNAVVAKPAEQTPLIARRAVGILHRAGVPTDVLHLVSGPGETVGAALVGDPRVAGIAFTGSTETAKRIARSIAAGDGPIIPLIAETGGVNAMVADSSALAEQLVGDVVTSAFHSAGQRCSACRVLLVQDSVADKVTEMLAGAMAELVVGDPGDPATDLGPVIDAEAQAQLNRYATELKSAGRTIAEIPLPPSASKGTFVAPLAVEVPLSKLPTREVFGPVLHVARWTPDTLGQALDAVAGTGYGLTLGIHSRVERFWRQVADRVPVGNVYVNRSMIGAVVGVQPFGGNGLSGTGPKAGGPHYLPRFAKETTLSVNTAAIGGDVALMAGG
ncbi:MAG TPA: bifunctional proline dehydrogenase/L-glutamate gamma-semialdehyde dehydrogenase PutA [Azospirillaceae bacterium]|nr:bifunctional proline dehydrogenase/L-glutamate gamma-semialdehyde dehydrogenase PutA [Azospirillaceae bacterium]